MRHQFEASSSRDLALHLVEEISHRVVNEYTEAISILSSGIREGAQAVSILTAAVDRLTAQAEAHRSLLVPVSDCTFELGAYIQQLCRALGRASLDQRGVQLTVASDEVWVEAERGWRVGLIITELVRNAVRHGLAGRPGAVDVTLEAQASAIRCVVTDTGRAESTSKEGRGRRLVRALASELDGSIEWCFSPDGSVVVLKLPSSTAFTA
jgi:two-component sensor histidine kinase